MKRLIIPIKGMHCRSCEILIEEGLSKIPAIKKATVSYKKKSAEIYCSQAPDYEEVENIIRDAGYSVGKEDKQPLLSKNPSDYKDLGVAFLFLVGIYIVLKNFGILDAGFGVGSAGNPSSLWIVLLIGLTAGFSTCMALVGGLVLGISGRHAEQHPEATPIQKFRPHLFFNIGRIASYAILGGVLGVLGSVFQISNSGLGILTIFVGLVMLLLGLQLTELFPRLNEIKITLPKFVSRALGIKNHEKEYSHKSSMLLGGMTFFLPCGFTQAMQLYAISTGSFLQGSMVMGMFAMGAAPGLLGIGGLTSIVKGIFAKRFFKMAGIVVIFLSLFNVANGYRLTGWENPLAVLSSSEVSRSVAAPKNDPNVKLVNGIQEVRMDQVAGGYVPNKFTIQKGIPVKWIIDSKEPYSCASSIVSSKLGVRKSLVKGENIIEFTPKEIGKVSFSCSMGMYTGSFWVVDESGGGVAVSDPENDSALSGGSRGGFGGGGCCGGGGASSGGGCGGAVGAQDATRGKTETISTGGKEQQVIKTVYTYTEDIVPNAFTVKAGQPVRMEIDVRENGLGCMNTILVPGLYDEPELLKKGTLVMEFTPDIKGDYEITCAMGMPRGTITVE